MEKFDRRDFLKLAGLGGVVYASGLPGCASLGSPGAPRDFHFLQLSDIHWGFNDPRINPDSKGTLPKAIAAVNSLDEKPDFVVFTGDLSHITDDPKVRRERLKQFRDLAAELRVPKVYYFAGEHDAAPDRGEAYQELFGETLHYAFDHQGIHFIVLDNVSDPAAKIGDAQLAWLKADLAKQRNDQAIVVFTHRPLFPLYPQWDWATRDGQQAIDQLTPYSNVTVFYGHIHHEHHHMTGRIAHHAAHSLMFPLAAEGSVEKRTAVPWDAGAPYKGLGFREVVEMPQGEPRVREFGIKA